LVRKRHFKNDLTTWNLKNPSERPGWRYQKIKFNCKAFFAFIETVCNIWYFHAVKGLKVVFAKIQHLHCMYGPLAKNVYQLKCALNCWCDVDMIGLSDSITNCCVFRHIVSKNRIFWCHQATSFEMTWKFMFCCENCILKQTIICRYLKNSSFAKRILHLLKLVCNIWYFTASNEWEMSSQREKICAAWLVRILATKRWPIDIFSQLLIRCFYDRMVSRHNTLDWIIVIFQTKFVECTKLYVFLKLYYERRNTVLCR